MKKWLCFLCGALLLCGTLFLWDTGLPVKAGEITLTAEVPKEHTVTVESDGGRVVADGVVLEESGKVDRHEEQVYWILPDTGKVLKSLTYNGTDVTDQVKNGVFKAPGMIRGAALRAVYEDVPPAPDNRLYTFSGTLLDDEGNPISGVTVDMGGKTGVTDENGTFELSDVPSGVHTVVITGADGEIIGHGEIRIAAARGTALELAEDEEGNQVISPGNATETIRLVLAMDKDGRVMIREAADATSVSIFGPKTGDSGLAVQVVLICAGMALAGVALLAGTGAMRKK